MSTTTDTLFDDLAQKTRQEASKIPCSIPEYIEGLNSIIDELRIAKDAAESALRKQEREND
jgi:hypothetical protein